MSIHLKLGTSSPKQTQTRARSNSVLAPNKPQPQTDPQGFLLSLGVDVKDLYALIKKVNEYRSQNEGKLTIADITSINFEFKKILGNIELKGADRVRDVLLKVLVKSFENDGFKEFNTDDKKAIEKAFFKAIASDPALSKEFHEAIGILGNLADHYKEAYATFLEMAQIKEGAKIMSAFRLDDDQAQRQKAEAARPIERISAATNNTTIQGKIETYKRLVNFDPDSRISMQRQADFAECAVKLKSIDPKAKDAEAQRMAVQKELVHTVFNPEDFRKAVVSSFSAYLAGQFDQNDKVSNEKVAKMINEGDDEGLKAFIKEKFDHFKTNQDFGNKLKNQLDKTHMFDLKALCCQYGVKLDLSITENNDNNLRYINTESLAYDFSQKPISTLEQNYLQGHSLPDLLLPQFKQTFVQQNKGVIEKPEAVVAPVAPQAPTAEEIQAHTQRRDAAKEQNAQLKQAQSAKNIAPKVASVESPVVSRQGAPLPLPQTAILDRLGAVTRQLEDAPQIHLHEQAQPQPLGVSPSVNPAFSAVQSQTRGRSQSASVVSSSELDSAKDHLKGLNLFGKKDESDNKTKLK